MKFSRTWQKDLFNQLMGIMKQEKAKRGETLHDKELELWRRKFGMKLCMVRRFQKSYCPFPRALVDGWTAKELHEMEKMYKRIFSGKAAGEKQQRRPSK